MPSGLWEMGVGRETRCLRDTSAQEVSPGHRDLGVGLGSSSIGFSNLPTSFSRRF